MAAGLDDFATTIASLPERARAWLEREWGGVGRAFSYRGLDNYLRGAAALAELGRGEELVLSFLESMPEVARAVGEEVVPETAVFLLSMASKTSGQNLTLIAAMAPVAARRLGDAALYRQFLQVLNLVLAQAPYGLRPMLEHLEPLLNQLTLGGIRRWAQWGAEAYRGDFEGQARYFALATPDSLKILQRERRGVVFVDVRRKLVLYLRALWGRDFLLRPTAADFESREGARPYIEHHVVHVPDAYDDWEGVDGLSLYRAALNHAAAHLVFSTEPYREEELTPLERAAVGVLEDARVERLAAARFPRLAEEWRRLIAAGVRLWGEEGERPLPVGAQLDRLALALAEGGGGEEWITTVCQEWERVWQEEESASPTAVVTLAKKTAALLGEIGVAEIRSHSLQSKIVYRDDNRFLWAGERLSEEEVLVADWLSRAPVRRTVSVMEMVNEVDVEFAGDDAQEVWVLPTEFWFDEGGTANARFGRERWPDPVHYPEWDYQIQLERPDWVTVQERPAPLGEAAKIDALLATYRGAVKRLERMVAAIAPQGMERLRRQPEGDSVEVGAAIDWLIDRRRGELREPRFMVTHRLRVRDVAVLLLLDLSESANDRVRGGAEGETILELTRAAAALLAEALARLGDRFAIDGFCSNERHDVRYFRIKGFEEGWGVRAKARLAGVSAQFSTRLGAALRHAGSLLRRQPQRRRLLFVLTDGEPADIDVRDPQYLRLDAQRAVQELARDGIVCYCLTLDPFADTYVARIFGANRYTIVERVERLPELLPQLYLGLTR
ncbi:MAG: hypothetical protein N2557_03070 [Hydrogenophilus sp.]|nr:hypothetical protein [Hydrogenophilus sp.]